MRNIFLILGLIWCSIAEAANPSFSDFDTRSFNASTANPVNQKVQLANPCLFVGIGNGQIYFLASGITNAGFDGNQFFGNGAGLSNLVSSTASLTIITNVNFAYITNLNVDVISNFETITVNTNVTFNQQINVKGNATFTNITLNAGGGGLTNKTLTPLSAMASDANDAEVSIANAHGVLTNTAAGPPSFGLLQNTEMQNSTMVINGASTALGGTASSNGGLLTNLNGQALTGAVSFVQWDASAFMTNAAFNSNTLAYVTPGAGNAALQGSSTCPFLLYPLSSQQGGTNQIFVQWTAPPGIGNAIGTFSFNLLLATNTPSVQSNIVAMIQASANGSALGTAIIQTNISPIGTGFLSTNISLGPLTISGSPIANSPVQFQLQLWNVTTGRITNAAWIESCRWTYTNSATQNGLLTGW